ncbi:MAG: ATP-binding cassette domain-containing protein, partial [Candidatus Atribacteria bacterium]|nr:ATP-binding cassette domain-containing protein [Candidatus Atribacteria bacterium]
EPTSVLTPQETEVLFKSLKDLKHHGKTIIFISHKLKEVKLIADKVTVMRDGKVISTNDVNQLDEHMIAHMMVGRKINFKRIPGAKKVGDPLFTVKNLSYLNEENIYVLKNINFEVKAGEILGVAGVDGNGQTELVEILTGLREATSGQIFIREEDVSRFSPREIREEKVAHIPEDRMKNGVAEHTTIEENIIVDRYYQDHFSNKNLFLDWKYISKSSEELIKKFKILTPSSKAAILSLSGGNIQKVVVARELSSNPRIIIAAQPTRGIDVGSEELIHNLLKDARDNGIAIFLVSADLDEVLKLSTRIIVIYNGEIVARFDDVNDITQRDLGPYMLGVKKKGE